MSPMKREWLLHGCMRLTEYDDADRPSLKIRRLVQQMYPGSEFAIHQWPQRDYRHTLWWYEKSAGGVAHVASYYIKLDNERGPNLYAGITVEKGFEHDPSAEDSASRKDQYSEENMLGESWDWHRFVASLPEIRPLIVNASQELGRALYLWIEYGQELQPESQYYVARGDQVFLRGGFKPIEWETVIEYVNRPRPSYWGEIYLARAFTLDECTPYLEEHEILRVFRALRTIRDVWRGLRPVEGA